MAKAQTVHTSSTPDLGWNTPETHTPHTLCTKDPWQRLTTSAGGQKMNPWNKVSRGPMCLAESNYTVKWADLLMRWNWLTASSLFFKSIIYKLSFWKSTVNLLQSAEACSSNKRCSFGYDNRWNQGLWFSWIYAYKKSFAIIVFHPQDFFNTQFLPWVLI